MFYNPVKIIFASEVMKKSEVMQMKKMAIFLMFITVSLYGQTWIRSYQWNDLCPGPYTNGSAEVWNVIPAIGGGYLLQGHVEFSYGDIPAYEGNAFWLIDEAGNIVWRRANDMIFKAYNSIVSNGIDRYYCIASSNGASYLNVYDAEMNFLNHYWFQQVNGYDLQLNDMQFVDDGLVFAGQRNGQGVILKTDFAFNVVWQNTPLYVVYNSGFYRIILTEDSGYTAINYDLIAKFDSEGDTLWTARTDPWVNTYYCISNHSNGMLFVLNRSLAIDSWTIDTYNDLGQCTASANTSLLSIINEGSRNMFVADDGNIIIYLASNQVINKVSGTGELIWSRSYPITTTGYGSKNMCIDSNGFIVFCGSGSLGRFTLIKTNDDGEVSTDDQHIPSCPISISHYPNPVSNSFTVNVNTNGKVINPTFEIYNLKGQLVYAKTYPSNIKEISLNIDELGRDLFPNGIYFYRIIDGNISSKPHKLIIFK